MSAHPVREIPDAQPLTARKLSGVDEPQLCRLEASEGRKVACPEDACVFWEPGGAVLEGRCALHAIDFAREPGLAPWLLEIRDAFER